MNIHERLAEVEAVLAPVLSEHGLSLVDLEWRREGRRWVLRFFVDRMEKREEPGAGVSIADCQRFSGEAGDILDASGLIPQSYDLEVSSPGLDRELKKEREFRWATGKKVRCWVSSPVGGRTEFVGHLRGVTEDLLSLEETDGRLRDLPRDLVTKARLEFDRLRRV